jgi:hypothetical protein
MKRALQFEERRCVEFRRAASDGEQKPAQGNAKYLAGHQQ